MCLFAYQVLKKTVYTGIFWDGQICIKIWFFLVTPLMHSAAFIDALYLEEGIGLSFISLSQYPIYDDWKHCLLSLHNYYWFIHDFFMILMCSLMLLNALEKAIAFKLCWYSWTDMQYILTGNTASLPSALDFLLFVTILSFMLHLFMLLCALKRAVVLKVC